MTGQLQNPTRIWALLNEKLILGCFKLLSWNKTISFAQLEFAFYMVGILLSINNWGGAPLETCFLCGIEKNLYKNKKYLLAMRKQTNYGFGFLQFVGFFGFEEFWNFFFILGEFLLEIFIIKRYIWNEENIKIFKDFSIYSNFIFNSEIYYGFKGEDC